MDLLILICRTWVEYEDEFGKLTGEFWYGLRALHCLAGQGGWEMRMDIKLANGTNIFLQYKQFKVASAKDKYKLTVEGFQGITSDPMALHNGMYLLLKTVTMIREVLIVHFCLALQNQLVDGGITLVGT